MFGEKLEFYRNEMNLSQEELGNIINVTKATISNWENGKSFPDSNKLLELAKLFGITTDCLLGSEPDQDEIEIFKGYLRRAGIMKSWEDITIDEISKAIDYVFSMKQFYSKENENENDKKGE